MVIARIKNFTSLAERSFRFRTVLLLRLIISITAWNFLEPGNPLIDRRRFVTFPPVCFLSIEATTGGTFSALSSANAAQTSLTIEDRFKSDVLYAPTITAGTQYTGHENLIFPEWLEGEWDATQTLVSTKAPLGLEFVGGPKGSINVAQSTMSEQEKRVNEPVHLKLRFVKTAFGVVEDRAFNARNRLNSFAGKDVVASVNYADTRESNRASVIAAGGSENDPLTTTVVYFKGPAAQKTFVISHGEEQRGSDAWYGHELDRSIFALTNKNTSPPVLTDTEMIYALNYVEDGIVEGRLRLAGYLNPQSDKLYFNAKNRAVSLNDYTLTLKRL